MNKKVLIGSNAAVIIIIGISVFANKDRLFKQYSSSQTVGATVQADTNSTTYKQYAELRGEDYDRMFLSNMIAHHNGAVEMANLALKNASHQKIKDLANDIVSAQTSEINDMTSWQKEWNYPTSSGDSMMDHSSMGMMDDMAGMSASLEGKTGDEFDKTCLEQMIMHHQSAINMAASGAKNAKHQEVKDLTVAIVTAQTKEIEQMMQWQSDWNY